MSISFSGLASGLDTTSWVESLTALKRAKVDTLEKEKETIQLTRETLNNIKSFFNSFRSVIEKVTDAKFGVASMDIFAQKLATSSNPTLVTANATTEAEESTYDVLVDKLATQTQAMSGVRMLSTITQTTTATLDTKLSDIGVKTGKLGVTVDGVSNIINIEENDTLGSFVGKLKNIGVDAFFNEKTGVFGVNADNTAFNDKLTTQADGTVGTGIIDALHLSEIGGYESSFLQTSTVETIVTTATGATKLGELGTINAGNIVVKANGSDYSIYINSNTTLQGLIDALKAKGVDAALSKDGELSIKDAEITDPNGTNIIDALGLQVDTNSITQTANNLQYKTVVTTQTSATNSTKLGDLEGWKGSNSVLTVKNGDGVSTNITLTSDMTVGDLVNKLNNAGLNAVITSDGTLNISGGEISGDGADVLGIEPGNGVIGNITLDGATLFAKATTYATENTRLEDLGITTSDQLIMCGADGHTINVFSTGIVPDEYHYIKNVLSSLSSNHFTASINEGRITISSSDGSYIKGGMAEKLGIGLSSSTITSGSTITSKNPLTYTTTAGVDLTTTFADLGIDAANKVLEIRSKQGGGLVTTIKLTNTENIGQLFTKLQAQGITGSLKDGVITLTSDSKYVAGTLANALGIATTSIPGTSSTVTITTTATTDTTFAQLGLSSSSTSYCSVYNKENYYIESITVSSADTIGTFITKLGANGITAVLTDGKLALTSSVGNYIEGDLANLLGIQKESRTEQTGYKTSRSFLYNPADDLVNNTSITGTEKVANGLFKKSITKIDTSSIKSISEYSYSGGETFKISTTDELVKFRDMVNSGVFQQSTKYFVLANDIDMSGISWDTGINDCSYSNYFTLDGNGYTIRNLNGTTGLYKENDRYIDIKNLGIVNATITVAAEGGILVNGRAGGLIDNCFIMNSVINSPNNEDIGGFASRLAYGTISNSYTDVTINLTDTSLTGTCNSVGGLVGRSDGTIDNCYTRGKIVDRYGGPRYIGGVAGYASGNISNVYSDMSIDSNKIKPVVGGIAAYVQGTLNVSNAFFAGTIVDKNGDKYNNIIHTAQNTTSTHLTIADIGCYSPTGSNIKLVMNWSQALGTNQSLSKAGIPSGYITIMNAETGSSTATVYIDATQTLEELGNLLTNYNISMVESSYGYGSLPHYEFISDSVYIKSNYSDRNDFAYGMSLDYIESTIYSNTTSTAPISYTSTSVTTSATIYSNTKSMNFGGGASTITSPATLSTKLTDINGHVFGNGKIAVHKANGSVVTITINTTQTLGDFFNQISAYGFTGSIDSSGNVTIKAQENAYLETVVEAPVAKTFMQNVTRRNTSGMTKFASVSESSNLTSGTYSISTTAELTKLATMTNNGLIGENTEFVLANNIDLSGYFTPIGNEDYAFKAKFDGNGYVISNLKIYRPSGNDGTALFGQVDGNAVIKNVGLADVNITGYHNTGSLVGKVLSSGSVTISNCYATGTVSGNTYVGGLVGDGGKATITNCYTNVTVDGSYQSVGGLVGEVYNATITNCYAAGDITNATASQYTGGLIGLASGNTTLTSCYATGTVASNGAYNGGLIGMSSYATIKNCYATGSVTGNNYTGGLLGGGGSSTLENAYFADTTGQTIGIANGGNGAATKVTTSELNTLIANGTLPDFNRAPSGSNLPDLFQISAGASQTIYANTTNGKKLSQTISGPATTSSKLGDIEFSDGSKLPFDSSGNTSLVISTTSRDGLTKTTTLNFTKTQSLNDVIQALSAYGIKAYIDGNGKFTLSSDSLSDFDITGGLGDKIGGSGGKQFDISVKLNSKNITTSTVAATRDTLLSTLGVTDGEYYIYSNGVKYRAMISSDETLGSFMDTLESFGLQAGLITNGNSSKLITIGSGNSYVAKSNNTAIASNVVEKLFGANSSVTKYNYTGTEELTTINTITSTATLDTLLKEFDTPWGGSTLKSEGKLAFSVNGENKSIQITADETFGSLIDKLNAAGVEAAFVNGKLYISDMNNFSINTTATTSSIINPNANIHLNYKNAIDGFMESSESVTKTTTTIEEKTLSAANYADLTTKLSLLNISDGTFSVFRNGRKAEITIDSEKTFGDLRAQIAARFSDVDLKFEDGELILYSKTEGVTVEVGTTTDTSNLLAVTGLGNNGDNTVHSARRLYRVNSDSVVTDSGLFRKGNVKAGTFIVGNQEIKIDDKTTIADIASQINSSDQANATAFWDSIEGRFVIKSRTTGSAIINIEAGTSNFTDIMGYTESEWNADGSVKKTSLDVGRQEIGDNAHVTINGTSYTSTSNTLTSDVTRIKGLTINLKGLTNGSAVQIKVEKDKESVANAMDEVVKAYNELMQNVDEAIAIDGKLHDQTILKLMRNRLRMLMTSTGTSSGLFKNLDSIGISVSAASANNISTSNKSIIDLSFDRDKFIDAFNTDDKAVKSLLLGTDSTKGIFINVEELLENALQGVTGYFDSTDNAYQRETAKIDNKITKMNKYIERYKAQLEKKFSSMDMMIASMQQQYSSFLGTGSTTNLLR